MLEAYIGVIESAKCELARRWTETQSVQSVLESRQIGADTFEHQYAIGVIEYFLGVLKQEKVLGDCPVMHKMLNDFADAHLTSEEVFIICAQLKRTIVNFAFENGFSTQHNIDQLNLMLDENFRGVIRAYDEIIHEHTKQLEAQQQLFLEYTNAINSSTIVSKTDTQGIITYVNKAFEEISGYTKDELIGQPHSIVRHPDMQASFFKEMWATLKNQQVFYGIVKNRHKEGLEYYVKSYFIPILDVKGETAEYISIRQDITELIHSLEYQQRLNVMKDDLFRNISHEIKTPLNSIVGIATIIQKKVNDPSLNQYVAMINDGAEQLQKIVSSIIELSQFTSGTYTKNLKYENLHAMFSKRLEEEKKSAILHNIDFKYMIDSKFDKFIECDMKLLNKILAQLIDNAKKFNQKNGLVAVKIALLDDGSLLMQVKDNGQGISKEQQEDIFDPFHQADSSMTRAQEGLGIGLAIIKKIVEFLNGTISVESEMGKGSLFTVKIPLD